MAQLRTLQQSSEVQGLRLSAVSKQFGALTVLKDLSFDVRPGEIHGLIGPNGAGKTTAVNIATGFYKPTSGTVTLNGEDVTGLPAHARAARGLGRSFQGARLFDKLDIQTNVRISLEQRARWFGRPGGSMTIRSEVSELLEEAGLASLADTTVSRLPYGLRKKVEVVRACAFASTVLLLDEPTSGLSHEEVGQILEVVGRHRSRLAILLIEHDMEVIMSLCDRITVIDAGRWLTTGSPAEVQENPEVIEAYLGTDG